MGYILNIERYIELLKKESSFNNQKKSLLFENKKEFLELLSYGSHVESQISYDRKNVYYSLIAKYLTKKINPGRFRSKFLQMQREDGEAATMIKKDLEQLATFSIDLKADEFSSLIEQIYDVSALAFEFGPEDGISEERFRDSVEKVFSEMEKYFDE